jgi:hypothetical protein
MLRHAPGFMKKNRKKTAKKNSQKKFQKIFREIYFFNIFVYWCFTANLGYIGWANIGHAWQGSAHKHLCAHF